MNRDERIVVVGGGLTGLRAAERLRELKFEGEITILGDEKLPPYHRPALSKQLLQGTLRPGDLTLPAYEDLGARWRFGTQVRQLVPNKKTLMLPGGEELTYDGLIIATGVEATRQNGVPYHDPRVLVLRTMSDGLDLERVIGSTKGRVAVVGGGFTGCELAASLRHLSREVTLIGRGKNLLGNVLGPELGEWLTKMHRDHGVDLALGNSVEEWAPGPEGIALKLTDGSKVLVSCVILAAGTKPMTHWLRGSGLPLDNGVVCEPTCHVVGAEDVVAAGDVAQWPNLRFDNVPRRVEHWLNAVEMGRAAAESLLAGRANAEPFCPMPRFWTDQYSARIQAAGMLKLGKDIVKLGTPDEGTGKVYGFSLEGRLMGVVGVDCPSAMIAWGESVGRQNPEPRPRIVAGTTERTAIAASTGSFSKKRPGKHSAPPQGKQFQREERTAHQIGFVEQPAEISGPVGVGIGRVPGDGRPKNVVDSFSRMLPVAVRPPGPIGGRTLPAGGAFPGFGAPPRLAIGPGTGHRPPQGSPPVPEFSAAEMTDVGTGGPPVDTTGQMALLDANGHVRAPEFSDLPPRGPSFKRPGPQDSFRVLPPAQDSFRGMPPAPATNGMPTGRGPQDSFGSMPAVSRGVNGSPVASGPQDSFGGLPPVRNGKPVVGGPQDSFSGLPAVGAARGPQDSFGGMPPVGRGVNGSPVAGGPQDSFGSKPGARGPQDSFNGMPPVSRGVNGSPVARGPQDSFGSMPPARRGTNGAARGPQDSFGSLPPVGRGANGSRGPQDSFGSMAPVSRGAKGSPVARGPQDSFGSMPPVSGGANGSRGPQDSFSSLPPVSRAANGSPVARGPQDSFGGMPPVRRPTNGAPGPRGSIGSRGAEGNRPEVSGGRGVSVPPPPPLPPLPDAAETGAIPPVPGGGRRRRSAGDEAFDTMPGPVSRGAHRAEDLTPEFGRPPKRHADHGGRRLAPALSSMDDSIEMPPVRMPKHGRPEDYGVPAARGGPEDSYDQMPAVARPRVSGGRRRARA